MENVLIWHARRYPRYQNAEPVSHESRRASTHRQLGSDAAELLAAPGHSVLFRYTLFARKLVMSLKNQILTLALVALAPLSSASAVQDVPASTDEARLGLLKQ